MHSSLPETAEGLQALRHREVYRWDDRFPVCAHAARATEAERGVKGVCRAGNEAATGSGQVSLRPLSADAAARISPTRMRHFNSAPGDFRRQHSVLSKYDAALMRSRTAAPDLARSAAHRMRLFILSVVIGTLPHSALSFPVCEHQGKDPCALLHPACGMPATGVINVVARYQC